MTSRSYCTFRLGGLTAGLEVEHVQEVLGARSITPVPLADRAIRGLVNLRGQIVLAVDLRRCLGLEDDSQAPASMSVVVRTPFGLACLLVDEVLEIVETRPDAFSTPPETLPPRLRSFSTGAYQSSGGLLLALDAEALIEALEEGINPSRSLPSSTSLKPKPKT